MNRQQNELPVGAGTNRPPSPPGLPLLGHLLQARRDPLAFALDVTRRFGDITYYRIGFYTGYLLNHPDYIQHVLQDNHRNYNKQNYNYEMLKPVLGEGLLTGNGDRWLRQRRMMQPVFHRKQLTRFAAVTTTATLEMLRRWEQKAAHREPLNMNAEMMTLTLQVVGKSLFGADMQEHTYRIASAFNLLNEDISDRFRTVFVPPLAVPTRRNRTFRRARTQLNRVVYEIIRQRRRAGHGRGDMLDMLLAARDECGSKGMSDREIRDQVMTLMLAGHETTATLLSWTWYLLAQHPEVHRNLIGEIHRVLGDRMPTAEDLPELPCLEMALLEVMRLYPPVWIISRKALGDDEIGGYRIPAGTIVALCPYTMHRHPGFWEEPGKFDPRRFTPRCVQQRHRCAYFPFGGGPRYCIGSEFAMMEARLILATVLQHYRPELVPDQTVIPEPLVTLRPHPGIKMTVHPLQ